MKESMNLNINIAESIVIGLVVLSVALVFDGLFL
jgi:hypothetical protein